MTDHTKHNAKIAQEFYKAVESGQDPNRLWDEKILINGDHSENHHGLISRFCFSSKHNKLTWKTETITIHGREAPKPMTKWPNEGKKYFFHERVNGYSGVFYDSRWEDMEIDRERFKHGIFDNEKDCEAFAEAYYRPWSELVE